MFLVLFTTLLTLNRILRKIGKFSRTFSWMIFVEMDRSQKCRSKFWNRFFKDCRSKCPDTYWEPYQTSNILDILVKTGNGFQQFTIFFTKLHLRFLGGLWIHHRKFSEIFKSYVVTTIKASKAILEKMKQESRSITIRLTLTENKKAVTEAVVRRCFWK